jgi:predicted transcriptional regulator
MRPIILSIKPKYAEAILSGNKKCEFRKAPFPKGLSLVILYASNGSGKIIGYFTVKNQVVDTPTKIWRLHSSAAGITREEYDDYYAGTENAMCIEVGKARRIEPPIDPFECIRGFVVPQSFRYMNEKDYACLSKKIDILRKMSIENIVENGAARAV